MQHIELCDINLPIPFNDHENIYFIIIKLEIWILNIEKYE